MMGFPFDVILFPTFVTWMIFKLTVLYSFGLYLELASGQLTFQLLHSIFALLLFQELLRVHRVHHLWRIFLFHTLDVKILKCQPMNGTKIISNSLMCSIFLTSCGGRITNISVWTYQLKWALIFFMIVSILRSSGSNLRIVLIHMPPILVRISSPVGYLESR